MSAKDDKFNPDSDDSQGIRSPKAFPRIIPKGIRTYKIPITEYNTCPWCEGKGYVKIIKDEDK